MNRAFALAMTLLAVIMFVGCEKKSETEKAKENAVKATDSAGQAARDATNNAADTSKGASDAAVEQAKKLLDEGMQYVKDNKLDLAEKSLNQLDAMKDKLPPEWSPKIDQLRSAIAAAKAAGGKMTLPGK